MIAGISNLTMYDLFGLASGKGSWGIAILYMTIGVIGIFWFFGGLRHIGRGILHMVTLREAGGYFQMTLGIVIFIISFIFMIIGLIGLFMFFGLLFG